jgi:hypothetical protein
MKRATNHTMQPMGASHLAQPRYGSPRRALGGWLPRLMVVVSQI